MGSSPPPPRLFRPKWRIWLLLGVLLAVDVASAKPGKLAQLAQAERAFSDRLHAEKFSREIRFRSKTLLLNSEK